MNRLTKFIKLEYLLLFLWAIIQFILFQKHGIKVVNDSHRYMEYANNLLEHGTYIDQHNKWYLTYVLFISGCFKLGLGVTGVVILQTLLSGFAFFLLSRAVQDHYPNQKNIGIILLALLIFWVKLSEWNFYVMTESMYISLLCVFVALLLKAQQKRINWYLVPPLVPILFFTRPSSLAFFGATVFVLVIIKLKASSKSGWFKSLIVLLAIIPLIVLGEYMLQTFDMTSVYNRGELVYAYGLYPSYPHQGLMVITPPEHLFIPSPEYPKIWQLISYIVGNPLFFTKLAFGKTCYFIGNAKPYFSWAHNIFIIGILWPLYFLAIKKALVIRDRLVLFTLSFVLLNVVIVVLATEDWDGRFLLPVLPIIFIHSAGQLANILNQKNRKKVITKEPTPSDRSAQGTQTGHF